MWELRGEFATESRKSKMLCVQPDAPFLLVVVVVFFSLRLPAIAKV